MTSAGDTEYFFIDIGLHQGSTLSPFLFTTVMDELTREIQDEIPWCMLFADDIVLVDETRDGLNVKLGKWSHTLESRGFRLSMSKTEYLRCEFSCAKGDGAEATLDGEAIPKVDKYLGLIIEKR